MNPNNLQNKLYFKYWGKAKATEDTGASYHLLPYHCLDVAAVGYQILAPDSKRCKQLAQSLSVEPVWLRDFFVLCLALHDLGKFSCTFQGLKSNLSANLVNGRADCYSERHDSLGFGLWRDVLCPAWAERNFEQEGFGKCLKQLEPWLEIVTGHHGMPPKKNIGRVQKYFEREDEQAALEFVEDVCTLLLADFDWQPLLDKTLKKRLKHVSWQLAGVSVLADWLGSNQDYFKYCKENKILRDYWQQTALVQARTVMTSLPETVETSSFGSIQNLFPFIEQPTPLQTYAINEPLTEQAQLFILEDVTGAGKTEAALVLTHRLLEKGLANGLYVALPTMATANAMYQRLGSVYRNFYRADDKPSLILAHGARHLSDEFRQSVDMPEHIQIDHNYQQGKQHQDQEFSATAYCNAWLADNRKKALLADIGVGTLDQVLLAVLPARHQSLRLLGLDRKLLLVDEVHAYDSYMQKLLDALLEAHARQGGSVILLSATLPQKMRSNLVDAFQRGLGQEAPFLSNPSYPLVTHTPAQTVDKIECALGTREQVKRTVKVKRLATEGLVIEQIIRAVKAGQCICWIRNTVKSARLSFQALLDAGIDDNAINLFHSRFAMIDRQAIETQTLQQFGDASNAKDRKGRVLIATQVVEQSLDLDFDVLISDLAPIDLLIQRAGRLRRHIRDIYGNRMTEKGAQDQRGKPVFYLFSPTPDDNADENWLKPDHTGTQAIYPHVGQLWLTAKLLSDKGQFTMPEDARELIEKVYSNNEYYPDALDVQSGIAEGEDKCRKSMADLNVLKLDLGYTRSSGDWDEETRIPTRLTEEETISVVLVVIGNGKLQPYAKVENYAWALSTIKLPEREWKQANEQIPGELAPLIEALKAEQKAVQWCEVLPLLDGQQIYSAHGGFVGVIPTDVGND